MIEALFREAERMELRARFAADAAKSEAEALASGRAISLDAAFDYLDDVLGAVKFADRAHGDGARRNNGERSRIWSDCLSSSGAKSEKSSGAAPEASGELWNSWQITHYWVAMPKTGVVNSFCCAAVMATLPSTGGCPRKRSC